MRSTKVLHAETTRNNIQTNFTTCKTPRKKTQGIKNHRKQNQKSSCTKVEPKKLEITTKKNPKLSSLETC